MCIYIYIWVSPFSEGAASENKTPRCVLQVATSPVDTLAPPLNQQLGGPEPSFHY